MRLTGFDIQLLCMEDTQELVFYYILFDLVNFRIVSKHNWWLTGLIVRRFFVLHDMNQLIQFDAVHVVSDEDRYVCCYKPDFPNSFYVSALGLCAWRNPPSYMI